MKAGFIPVLIAWNIVNIPSMQWVGRWKNKHFACWDLKALMLRARLFPKNLKGVWYHFEQLWQVVASSVSTLSALYSAGTKATLYMMV